MKNGWLNLALQAATINLYGCSEQDLQRQVSLAKSQLRDLRMSNESNQAKLLDHTQRQGNSHSRVDRISVSDFLDCNRSRSCC